MFEGAYRNSQTFELFSETTDSKTIIHHSEISNARLACNTLSSWDFIIFDHEIFGNSEFALFINNMQCLKMFHLNVCYFSVFTQIFIISLG